MHRRDRDLIYAGLGAAAGLFGAILATRKLRSQPQVPFLKSWRQALTSSHGPARASYLSLRIQQRYLELYRNRPDFRNPTLRLHLAKNILPGLALYQVLLEESSERPAALEQTDSLLALGMPQARLIPWIIRLPGYFSVFRWLIRAEMKWLYPPDGWQLRWLQDDDSAIDFHIYRCFYLDVLTSYGASELTPLFCRLDDLLGDAMAPAIQWRRLNTLGRGGEVCDFCFINSAHAGEYMDKGQPNKV